MKLLMQCLVVFSLLFSLDTWALISEQTRQAAVSLGAASLCEVEFALGSDQLTDQGRAEIRNAIEQARQKGLLDYVNVLAWSDQEYPAVKTSQSKSEIKLAKRRIANLRDFLKTDAKIKNVSGFNMAERPAKIKEFLGTKEARVKKTTEVAGAAPVEESAMGLFGEKGQASKAVLMIFTRK